MKLFAASSSDIVMRYPRLILSSSDQATTITSLLVSSLLHTAAISISTEAIVRDDTAIDTFAAAIVVVASDVFPLFLSVHQRVMSTPKGAVVFVDQVLQVEIFLSPGYRFEDEEDGSVYSDGGDLDQFVPRREWPDKPLPEAPEPSISSPVQAPTTVSADWAQLIADLQAVHDATVKSLEAMGVNACEDYMQHRWTLYSPKQVQVTLNVRFVKRSSSPHKISGLTSLVSTWVQNLLINVSSVRRPLVVPMPLNST